MRRSIAQLVRASLTASLAVSLAAPSFSSPPSPREAALEAAKWIRAAAVRSDKGTTWLVDPREPKSVNHSLYTGTAGVVLFFLEAYRATGDKSYLADARAGADTLMPELELEPGAGLYVGISGMGFALAETWKITRDVRYLDGARQCVRLLEQRAKKAGSGVEWWHTRDVISGTAGTGLFLLYAARELKEPAAKDLAVAAGHRLLEQAQPEHGGLRWSMGEQFPRLMPNFAHGTAGISYFLATLYQETHERKFLDAALAGARYLQAVAKTDGNVCLIFHNEVDGNKLYYLSWCHGPAGTARLFYRLYQITHDKQWLDWAEKGGRAVLAGTFPDQRPAGFWYNLGQCCGLAGSAEFCLEMYRLTRNRQYLDQARHITMRLLARATRDDHGMRWVQDEHRFRPELLLAQTGYMHGAAGIGSWMLHLDEFERGQKRAIRFPDSPW